jgi:hypothetical protein
MKKNGSHFRKGFLDNDFLLPIEICKHSEGDLVKTHEKDAALGLGDTHDTLVIPPNTTLH